MFERLVTIRQNEKVDDYIKEFETLVLQAPQTYITNCSHFSLLGCKIIFIIKFNHIIQMISFELWKLYGCGGNYERAWQVVVLHIGIIHPLFGIMEEVGSFQVKILSKALVICKLQLV